MHSAEVLTAICSSDHLAGGWLACALQKDREVDGLGHLLVAGVTGMQMVTAVVLPEHPVRVLRVADSLVEIEDRVESTAGPDPPVQPLSLLLPGTVP